MAVVLIAEDEPILRMLAVEMLEDAGFEVVDFGNAAEAIAYCDQPGHPIRAVLTDINMPGELDGLDLARHIRVTRPDTNIVVTSGRYGRLPPPGIKGAVFLPKPWTAARLAQAIVSPRS